MDWKEFELYRQPHFMAQVEENIGRDPLDIALDRTLPNAREVATRVKYLQRARMKLPDYYRARCILPGRAFEQSSGQRAAFSKKYTGELCLDLTCGLGVDSFALSRGFARVVAVEPDELRAEIARYNFRLMGVSNIEVVTSTAEQYLSAHPDIKPDLLYLDPDRRDIAGRKMAALADCSPDVEALLPRLREISGRVVVKLSPLFDVHEAFRVFGERSRVTVISDAGECKEVLVETGREVYGPVVAARALGQGEAEYTYRKVPRTVDNGFAPAGYGYLAVPDVALAKAGVAQEYYCGRGWTMPSPDGYAFGNSVPADFIGRVYRIKDILRYSPKQLKSYLRQKDIKSLNFLIRGFREDAATVKKQLAIREGGTCWAAFTAIGSRRWCLLLEPV
ncbi:MAG: class I SAM-dependent methyltransferase [Alistipes sp.]|nr:class I SAM-dependent methyltransferase [Alistipes sp.]